MHEDNEYINVLRQQNKTLRRINSILRSDNQRLKHYADLLFLLSCGEDILESENQQF